MSTYKLGRKVSIDELVNVFCTCEIWMRLKRSYEETYTANEHIILQHVSIWALLRLRTTYIILLNVCKCARASFCDLTTFSVNTILAIQCVDIHTATLTMKWLAAANPISFDRSAIGTTSAPANHSAYNPNVLKDTSYHRARSSNLSAHSSKSNIDQ